MPDEPDLIDLLGRVILAASELKAALHARRPAMRGSGTDNAPWFANLAAAFYHAKELERANGGRYEPMEQNGGYVVVRIMGQEG